MTRLEQVVAILDRAIGGPNVNIPVHGAFWRGQTRDTFVELKVRGLDLLVVGNSAASNLIKALKGQSPFGADLGQPPPGARFDRMPSGLDPVADADIAFIAKWIDDGCPAEDAAPVAGRVAAAPRHWRPTNAPVASSRTDDIWFTDARTGWAVNSNGQIVKTTDGFDTYVEQFHDPDVYFRCIGFASPTTGWAGTLTRERVLFGTRDSGATWTPVANLPALAPSAVCGMSVVNEKTVFMSGTNFPNRPPRMTKTVDGGATWSAWEMSTWASLLVDTYFLDERRGWVVGGKTDEAKATRNNVKAVVLYTDDGGETWTNRAADLMASAPMGEWGWKIQFLNHNIGFVSLENFNAGAILKTTDAGVTWHRVAINDQQKNANLEGVGFVDEQHGWVGGWGDANFQRLSTSETLDGGRSWRDANEIGKALNRFRFFGEPVTVGYVAGQTVYKYSADPVVPRTAEPAGPTLLAGHQPDRVRGSLPLTVAVPAGARRLTVRVWDRFGERIDTPLDETNPTPGPRTIEWNRGGHDPGHFIFRVTVDDVSESHIAHVGHSPAPATQAGEHAMHSVSHAVLKGSHRGLLSGSKLLGAAHPDEQVEVTVKIRRKTPLPELDGRPQSMISRQDAVERYGAAQADVDKVRDVLRRFGLTFIKSDLGTRNVEMAGSVDALQKAFQVKLFRYQHDGGEYRGRSGYLHVPAELDGIVTGIYGLDNRKVLRRRGRKRAIRLDLTAKTTARRGFFPADLAKLYKFPDGDGAGQSVGILEFGGGYLPDDLELFCQQVGVDVPEVVPVSVDNAPVANDDAATGEVMLDIEVVAGVCPKAKIPVYFAPDLTERSLIDIIDSAVHDADNDPSVLSISWGDFEESQRWSDGTLDHVSDAFKEAAMIGVTICVASGDDGSDDGAGDGLAHADFPSSSPYVLAVGGTDLRVVGQRVTERTWKDGDGRRQILGGTGGATGGGVSSHFPRPSFQNAIAIQSVNPGAITGRVLPDISAHAETDGATRGYFMVLDRGGLLNGGTSASAPLIAAMVARINAELQKQKGPAARAGYLTPVLYQAGTDGHPVGSSACKDITTGDNISAAGGGYRALEGYDAVTGWGSPIGSKLLEALLQIV